MTMREGYAKLLIVLSVLLGAAACGSSASNNAGVVPGPQDNHCAGQTLNPPTFYTCPTDAQVGNSNNTSTTPDYGPTMYNAEGDDDDCKYHVSWSANTTQENKGVAFNVHANWLFNGQPLTGAYTYAEVFLNDTHPAPNTNQGVLELVPGEYTITPIEFDAPGQWTVRFHFYENCDDAGNSLHGHAAFYVNVP